MKLTVITTAVIRVMHAIVDVDDKTKDPPGSYAGCESIGYPEKPSNASGIEFFIKYFKYLYNAM